MAKTRLRFQITYDTEADVLGVRFPVSSEGARTLEIATGIHADVRHDGQLVSVEVLDASTRYPATSLSNLPAPDDWLTLSEAAAESGITPDGLRRQALNGRLAARKRGRDWIVSAAALWNYLESRVPSGRRPLSAKGRRLRQGAPTSSARSTS